MMEDNNKLFQRKDAKGCCRTINESYAKRYRKVIIILFSLEIFFLSELTLSLLVNEFCVLKRELGSKRRQGWHWVSLASRETVTRIQTRYRPFFLGRKSTNAKYISTDRTNGSGIKGM